MLIASQSRVVQRRETANVVDARFKEDDKMEKEEDKKLTALEAKYREDYSKIVNPQCTFNVPSLTCYFAVDCYSVVDYHFIVYSVVTSLRTLFYRQLLYYV